MKRIVFNVCLPTGLAMLGFGIGAEFGAGYGLIATGAAIVLLTVYFARFAGIKG